MTARPRLDEVLDGAALPPAQRDEAEIAASRQAIEADLAGSVWQEALRRDAYARHVLGRTRGRRPAARPWPSPPAALRTQVARDLDELCRLVVTTSHAASDIAGLVNSRKIEPDGALIFACLLHLADRENGAMFWWQFSAGAGKSTAALCLYLLHLQRGEARDAEHWARQATELERPSYASGPGGAGPPLDHPRHVFYATECRALYDEGFATVESMLLRIVSSGWGGAESALVGPGDPAARLALAAAIQHLDVSNDPCFGDVPRPDPALAASLEECLP